MPITAYPPTPETVALGRFRFLGQPAFRLRYFISASLTIAIDVVICLIVLVHDYRELTFSQGLLLLGAILFLMYLWRRAVTQHGMLYQIQLGLQQGEMRVETESSLNTALSVSADLINSGLFLAGLALNCVLTVLVTKLGKIDFRLLIALVALAYVMILLAYGPGKRRYI